MNAKLSGKSDTNHTHDNRYTVSGNDVPLNNGKSVKWNGGACINGNTQSLLLGASSDSNYQLQLGVADSAWCLHPTKPQKLRLGSSSYRWREIYSDTGSIQTSDRNYKNNISKLSDNDKIKRFFLLLIPVSFTFKESNSGRTHIGFISQDVEDAMNKANLTSLDFAGFCKDQKYKVEIDEDGISHETPIENEYIYSLRYEEFIALNTMMIQELYIEIEKIKSFLNS